MKEHISLQSTLDHAESTPQKDQQYAATSVSSSIINIIDRFLYGSLKYAVVYSCNVTQKIFDLFKACVSYELRAMMLVILDETEAAFQNN